jgi:hypothetical protein
MSYPTIRSNIVFILKVSLNNLKIDCYLQMTQKSLGKFILKMSANNDEIYTTLMSLAELCVNKTKSRLYTGDKEEKRAVY